MYEVPAKCQLQVIASICFVWLCAFVLLSPPVMAQDALWSSMYDNAAKAFADSDFARAEKLTLETVEEAESLSKGGIQLAKSLELLRKIYFAQSKKAEAEKVAARIESLGGLKEEPEEKTETRADAKPEVEQEATTAARPYPAVDSRTKSKTVSNDSLKPAEKKDSAEPGKLAGNFGSDACGKGLIRDKEAAPPKMLPGTASQEPIGNAKADSRSRSAAEEPGELAIEREIKNTSIATTTTVSPVKTEGYAPTLKLKEILKLEGHMGWSKCVDISADATQALSGSADNTMRLWDLASGKEFQKFEGHDEPVNSVAFSPAGDRALSGSSDKTVRLWDLDAGTEIKKFLGHANIVTCVAFAPVGTLIASGGYDGTVRLWDSQTGKEVCRLEGNLGTIKCLAFTPEAEEIITGGTDKILTLWNVKSGKKVRTFTGHCAEVATVAVSDDGKRVISGGRDTTVRTWDIDSGDELKCMTGHTNWVIKVRFISVDKAMSGSLDKTLRIWDVDEGQVDKILNLQHFGMWSLGISELGDKAITGSDDFTLRVWQTKQ
ncbi:MAG: WD40 repeat domain-containing protein [Candidatus Melainabacteria bacterium]|nr:WD40 repeat domain-containing protein [Candidatus Melainabacteria bacterium]